jgi:hypothetical protein
LECYDFGLAAIANGAGFGSLLDFTGADGVRGGKAEWRDIDICSHESVEELQIGERNSSFCSDTKYSICFNYNFTHEFISF